MMAELRGGRGKGVAVRGGGLQTLDRYGRRGLQRRRLEDSRYGGVVRDVARRSSGDPRCRRRLSGRSRGGTGVRRRRSTTRRGRPEPTGTRQATADIATVVIINVRAGVPTTGWLRGPGRAHRRRPPAGVRRLGGTVMPLPPRQIGRSRPVGRPIVDRVMPAGIRAPPGRRIHVAATAIARSGVETAGLDTSGIAASSIDAPGI